MLYQHPQFQFVYKRPWRIKKAWLAHKGFFKRLVYSASVVLFMASVVALNILLLPRASAVTPRPAIDALGQTDGSFNSPVYTTSDNDNAGNMPESNHIGFHQPYSAALDSVNHRLFIADNQNNRVVVHSLDASNHFSSTSAVHAIGQGGFSTNTKNFASSDCVGGTVTPTRSTMCDPTSVLYDSAGQRLFVADSGWKRVLVYDLSGGITDNMNAANVIGQANFTTFPSSCTASQTSLCNPDGLAYDSTNKLLYVGDGARVMVFDLSGGVSDNMNASHVLGQANFTSNTCGATGQNKLCLVSGISYDSANTRLFVSDKTWNRITVFDLSGGVSDNMNASHVLGQINFSNTACAATQSGLCSPYETSYDNSTHRFFVGDITNNRVMIFDLTGGVSDGMNAAHVLGQLNFTSTSINTHFSTSSQVYDPFSTVADSANNQVFVVATGDHRVMRFDLSGGITDGMAANQEIGQADLLGGAADFALDQPDNRNPNASGLNYPTGIKIDPVRHRMFVADTENNRVLIYNLDTSNNLIDHTADNVLGQPDFKTTYHDCWVSPASYVTQNSLCEPMAMYLDVPNDLLYVADYSMNRIMVYDFSGGITDNMNAAHVLGQPNFTTFSTGCGGSTDASHFCQNAGGITYDPNHKRLFVGDENNNRVLVYDLSSGITDGMAASHVLGQANFTDNQCNYTGAGPATNTSLCFLQGQDLDGLDYDASTDTLFVADARNQRVMIYDLSGGIIDNMPAVHELGHADFSTRGCSHTQSGMCDPYDLHYIPSTKKLFVSDDFNDRVMIFDLYNGITDGMNAQAQIGQTNFTTVASNTTQTGLSQDYGVFFDTTTNKLYVADTFNNRVTVYRVGLSITTTSLPDGEVGSSYTGGTIGTEDSSGNVSCSVTAGSLPPGLSLNSSTCDITGTPTTLGTYPFTVQATDQSGATASQSYTVHISEPYLAADLLGQVNGSDQPIWTQSASNNNSGGPNAQGLSSPTGTVMDTVHHRLFVADMSNSRVLVYNLDANNNLIDHTADNVLGQPNLTTGGGFTNCTFNSGTPSASNMCEPVGPAYDPNNNRLFVPDAQDSRVLEFDLSGGITDGMAATHVLGQAGFGTDNCTTSQSTLCGPWGGSIYDASSNKLYVADSNNARVMVYDLSGAVTNGMNASVVLGQGGFGSSTPTVTRNGLGYPDGLALDTANHRLFVADWNSAGRVMVFDTSVLASSMNATNELGETDFTSSNSASDLGGPPDAKSFGPLGLAYDSNHQLLFVEDDNISRIMVFDVNGITNNEDAMGVLGQSTLTINDGCQTTQRYLCFPDGPSDYYDTAHNRLYASDNGNNRIMIYDFARLAYPTPDGSIGTPYSFNTNAHSQGTTSFALTSGALPNGLNLNSSSGQISGTPTTPGTFNFAIHMADDNGGAGIFPDDHNYTINIPAGGGVDSTPPSTPTNLQAACASASSIILNWSPSSDNVGVAGYNIYRNGGGVPIAAVGGTGFTNSGLNPSTTYTYTVTAFDAANNESGHSNEAAATTGSSGSGCGGGQGGNSQGGNNNNQGGGGNQNNQSSTPPAPVDLDTQPNIDTTGYTTDSTDGQQFTFSDNNGVGHTITVETVTSSSASVDIDGDTSTIFTGQKISKDVNFDGHNDIDVILNSIDNGQANLTFHKIIFAIAPGGQIETGVGAGGGKVAHPAKAGSSSGLKKILEAILFIFPWLLFIFLGSAALRLTYLSAQERRYAARLNEQLAKEKALAETKNNFIALASHYLRTPVTIIGTGIELAASLSPDMQAKSNLKNLSGLLSAGVNDILVQAEHKAPAETIPISAGEVVPGNQAPGMLGGSMPLSSSAGFIRTDSLKTIVAAMLGAFGLVGLADYILSHIDINNVGLTRILTQLAGILLAGILLVASSRSYHKRKELSQQAEKLLANQRELDSARNTLIKNSLDSLKEPLRELKAKLEAAAASPKANPAAFKPALSGITQLEGLLGKFVIATSLEGGTMDRRISSLGIDQLVNSSMQRYASAIQGKRLVVKNDVKPDTVNQDGLLVSFVVDSLLSNAIKYSPPGGEVRIKGGKRGRKLEMTVEDKGVGIAADKQASLFQPFAKAENAVQDFNAQGAGLSLYLDKLLMDYLDGQITLDSKPGQGTSVSISLPA